MPFILVYEEDGHCERELLTLGALRSGLPVRHRTARLAEFLLTEGTPTEDERFLMDRFLDLAQGAGSGPNWALSEALRRLEHHVAARVQDAKERGARPSLLAAIEAQVAAMHEDDDSHVMKTLCAGVSARVGYEWKPYKEDAD